MYDRRYSLAAAIALIVLLTIYLSVGRLKVSAVVPDVSAVVPDHISEHGRDLEAKQSNQEEPGDFSDVREWRKQLVRGRAIRFANKLSRGKTIQSLGPLEDTTALRITLQREAADYARREEEFGVEKSLEDVVARTKLSMKRLKRAACLALLDRGEYVTLEEGSSVPPLPHGASWLRFHGGSRIHDTEVLVLFILMKGDHAAFDDAQAAYEASLDAFLETKAGQFNNQDYELRRKAITDHIAARKRISELANSKNLTQEAKLAAIRLEEEHLIDERLSIDQRQFLLTR